MPHGTTSDDRISWHRLLAYGAGGIIPIALYNIAIQLMGLIGNIGLGLSAFWLGLIQVFPRLWDAVSDPLMGHLTDNTRSRWGRRRPYLLFGGIAVAATFVLMWWVPEDAEKPFQLGYILFGMVLFFTAATVFEIPHGALGMEMSGDYHERTRLFSAKSFMGNLFAMGTPWLFFLASLEFFKGAGGNEADGMRYVSLLIAAVLIPLSFWWFFSTREPGFKVVKKQKKPSFWTNMRTTFGNRTFIRLVLIVFTLAMGFNFVSLLNYYITIFYVYGGNKVAAAPLMGINGTVWAVTGLLAVFPLNWISRRTGKNKTLIIAILLMTAAQLSKIVCYNPELPYLLVIPTLLLSAGMLFFFTLGASMVGDVCDEDDLKTGTRSEGSYYSVYWWFIKMGTALASFVTGALILISHFDEQQTVRVDDVSGAINIMIDRNKQWGETPVPTADRKAFIAEQSGKVIEALDKAKEHFRTSSKHNKDRAAHVKTLLPVAAEIRKVFVEMEKNPEGWAARPEAHAKTLRENHEKGFLLARQSGKTLLWLRILEIGIPLVLCMVSLLLAFFYPLTEKRAYEVKRLLKKRNALSEDPANQET